MNLFEKIWSRKNYRIAFVLAVVMIIWLLSSIVIPNGGSGDQTDTAAGDESLTAVQAQFIHAEDFPISVMVRARTEPNRSVDLKAEVGGPVVNLPVEKGETVKAGDVICELSPEDRAEIVEQARSGLAKAQIDFEGAQSLRSGGYQSRSEIAAAEASLEIARATYKRAQLDMENLQIRAPFDGIVDDRPVEIGDVMQAGDVCAQILDMDPLLVTGRVSEADISHVRVGTEVEAALRTGESLTGKIRFVQKSSDDVTRTFRVEAVFDNPALELYSGISAQLIVPVDVVKAHPVNSSLLLLNDEGGLGLRILNDQNRVEYFPVELVGDDVSGVWVTGLPETTRLITVGQHYVIEGEEVSVAPEDGDNLEAASSDI